MTQSTNGTVSKTYAGLDVSLKETAVCIVDDGGKIVFKSKVQSDPKLISNCLGKHGRHLERAGLESGMTSAWLWRELRQLAVPVICLDSRQAHRALSMKRNENDRNDARGLADLIRMGWYREARVRSLDAQFVRSLLLSRQQILQSRRNVENQICGTLKDARRDDRAKQGSPLHAAGDRAARRQRIARSRARSAARCPRIPRQAAEDRISERRLYVPPPEMRRLTLDVASRVARIGRAEPHTWRASRGAS